MLFSPLRSSLLIVAALFGTCEMDTPPKAPTVAHFQASAATVCGAKTVTLTWTATDATSVSIDNGVGDVTAVSSKDVPVNATTTYTLTATGKGGTATATTTVTLSAFPELPFGAELSGNASQAVVSSDGLSLAYSGLPSVLLCHVGSCAPEPLPNTSLYTGSVLLGFDNGHLLAIGDFYVGAANVLTVFSDASGAFDTGVSADAVTAVVPLTFSSQATTGNIAVTTVDAFDGILGLTERQNGVWGSEQVYLAGAYVKPSVVVGGGYASDGTAWILYFASADTLTLIRRSGATWSLAASRSLVFTPAIVNFVSGARSATSPDGKKTLVALGRYNAGEDSAFAVMVDMETNTIGAPTQLLAPVPISLQNFSTHVAFSPDGSHATYSLNTFDGRGWTGTYDSAAGTFSQPIPFHPEKIVADLNVAYDSCGEPFAIATSRTATDPVSTSSLEILP